MGTFVYQHIPPTTDERPAIFRLHPWEGTARDSRILASRLEYCVVHLGKAASTNPTRQLEL